MPALGQDEPIYEVRAVNMQRRLEAMEVISYLLEVPLAIFVLIGLFINCLLVLVFGLLFWASGEDCYENLEGGFNFKQMLWLSAHTYTTMGNCCARCGSAQIMIILENYAGLLLQLVLGGVVLVKVMTPRAKLRFATNCVIAVVDQRLLIRLANDTRYPLEHCSAQVRCMLDAKKVARAKKKAARVSPQIGLPLDADSKAFLATGEHWVLVHQLGPTSPLAVAGGIGKEPGSARFRGGSRTSLAAISGYSNATETNIFEQLAMDTDNKEFAAELEKSFDMIVWLDVMLSVFDPVYGQQVRFNKRYFASDIISHAEWEDMLKIEVAEKKPDGAPKKVFVLNDHDKLDRFRMVTPDNRRTSFSDH